MRFYKPLLIGFLLLIVTWACFYFTLGSYNQQDQLAYQQLAYPDSNVNSDGHTARQQRIGLQKELYLNKGGQKQILRLQSEQAEMALERREKNFDIIEVMSNVTGILLNDQMQPLIKGVAQRIEFSIGGKDLNFKAHSFKAKHQFGKLEAEQASVVTDQKGKAEIEKVYLDHDVNISLSQGGMLTCSHAQLFSETLSGVFTGDADYPLVTYSHTFHDSTQEGAPLILQSLQLFIQLAKEDNVKPFIKEILADGHVNMTYNHDVTITAAQAIFQHDATDSGLSLRNPLPGLITFLADANEGFCQLENNAGDHITAKQIVIDTIRRQLLFTQAKGTLLRSRKPLFNRQNNTELVVKPAMNTNPIEFSADQLLWDEAAGVLTLRDHVDIKQEGLGHLQTAKELRLFQHIEQGQKSLSAMETEGETLLTFNDASLSHSLRCYGSVKVDHKKMETRLFSVPDATGNIPEEQQVYFYDARGDIYADRALIKYQYFEHTFVPTKVVLLGNVKIRNHLTAAPQDSSTVLQYALAERVEFYPLTKEMVFTSKPGQRVLFYDKANNLEVSATTLKIIRDHATKKESVQGVGNVRFSFMEHELDQLRRKFLLDKKETPK